MTDNQAVGTLSVKNQLGLLLKAVLAVGAVALLVLAYRHFTYKEPVAPPPLPEGVVEMTPSQMATLKVEAVGGGDGWLQTAATGMIAVDENRATPIFLPYSGQVTQVMVQQGATVVEGQPLLTLRTSDVVDARNALFGAAAARSSAFAAAKLAEENLKRQEQIYRTAGGALRDYEQARNDAVAAQAALRSAEATLGAARDKLEIYGKSQGEIARLEGAHDVNGYHPETTFRAPIGGVIATRAVSPGQFVQVGGTTPVLTIANPSRVWLVAQLAESDAPHVHMGDQVDVTVSAFPGRVFQAVVDNIASALDPVSHRLPVRATIANPDGALKPQMFANFTIRHQNTAPAAGRPVMSVPAQAVIRENDTARVWIQISPNRFRCVDVTLGESHNGRVDVTSGLKGGEKVVTTGAIFVNEAGFGA
ncbi:efflux RND transporter periplasmic adaptor subunit [Novosphingobium humi]|uniref:Efflux RND transporter periplasmic adaptor subunit n=1 Tax=Novosphingobium humi TaxID=2282397 RepID=A0ABY7TWT1_9SPHN|nr:efflux RND transporter periplasmic adaptor subunit [Novosphingobium humi]WCT77722.1 efflux RND transporter periplasmic adaptor subunit [Novosphingobium humi]WJS98755.1 efflux RND transporter periplasmic adaptor subunit [Novosphingobium humi]